MMTFSYALASYFTHRRTGRSVDEALASLIRNRFASASRLAERKALLQFLAEVQESGLPERSRVTAVVLALWCRTSGVRSPKEPQLAQYREEIARLYDQLQQR